MRPTKYKPEYCEGLIDHMGSGLSFESYAGVLRTCRDTLYEWKKVYPEFSYAHRTGIELNLLFWEQAGRQISVKGGGNSSAWKYNIANRHKWSERSEVSSPDGQAPINVNIIERAKQDD